MLAALAATACSHAGGNRYELRARAGAGSGYTTIVAIAADNRVRLFPGTPLEEQPFMRGKPEYHFVLRGDQIVDGNGVDQVSCKGDHVLAHGKQVARLGAGWFATDTTKVTIGSDGAASIVRAGQPADANAMYFTGLSRGDACIAALLYFMIPAPRAG